MSSVYTITDDTDTTDIGRVQTDGSDGSNGLFPLTLPEQSASEALLIPTTGPSEGFQIEAIFIGTENELVTFIAKLRKWVTDGSSLSKSNITYTSGLEGAHSVRAINWSKRWIRGDPNKMSYTLTLVKGTFT